MLIRQFVDILVIIHDRSITNLYFGRDELRFLKVEVCKFAYLGIFPPAKVLENKSSALIILRAHGCGPLIENLPV